MAGEESAYLVQPGIHVRRRRGVIDGQSQMFAPVGVFAGGAGGSASDTCDDSLPPQLWMLTTSRSVARWQEGVTRDLMEDEDATTGTAIPDWQFSTGFVTAPQRMAVKGLLVDSDGPVVIKTAKTVSGTGTAEAREFGSWPVPDQDEVWIPAAGDFSAQEMRLEFRGGNEVELRQAMVEIAPVNAKGG